MIGIAIKFVIFIFHIKIYFNIQLTTIIYAFRALLIKMKLFLP